MQSVILFPENFGSCSYVGGKSSDMEHFQFLILLHLLISDNKGSGDICFFVPKAAQRETGELIVVADYTKSRLLLLDHVTNCRILGQFRMESPLSLTKGSQGSLWLVCDSKRDESTVFVF